jgi:hypothetical protein
VSDIPTKRSRRKLPPRAEWPLEAIFGSILITIFELGGIVALAVILGWQL